MKRMQKGFTLIELVIVMVIIGVLSAVAAPKYFGMTEEAKKAADAATIGAVESAIAIQMGKKQGIYPTVTELASAIKVKGWTPTASATGICFDDDSSTAVKFLATFKDDGSGGETATAAVGDNVIAAGTTFATTCP